MREFEAVIEEVKRLKSVTCNLCGKTIDASDWQALNTVHQVIIAFSYPSRFDGERWEFDVCDDCVARITQSFVVPVSVKEIL